MATKRIPAPTTAILEERETELFEEFNEVVSQSHVHLDLQELKQFSNKLKEAYFNLLSTFTSLKDRYDKSGRTADSVIIQKRRTNVTAHYKSKYFDLRNKRIEENDEDLSTAPPSVLSLENVGELGWETSSQKIRRYFGDDPPSMIEYSATSEGSEITGLPKVDSTNPRKGAPSSESLKLNPQ